jgi:hypothetical protein
MQASKCDKSATSWQAGPTLRNLLSVNKEITVGKVMAKVRAFKR